tara:strand:- start:426 stop:794 length:369 start_codon:yes stop_codon:yes gene_type:complete
MNLSLVFKINAVINAINGLGLLFATAMFFQMANLPVSPAMIVIGQFTGVTVLFIALLSWRMPQVAGEALSSMGQLFAIGGVMWFLIIGYHIITGQVSGPTAYINIILIGLFAILFFMYSRKS